MPVRAFDDDTQLATLTSLPVPRGIAFHYDPDGLNTASSESAAAGVGAVLPGWTIVAIDGLPGWFEAIPSANDVGPGVGPGAQPAGSLPVSLGDFWKQLRALQGVPGVKEAEPLFLVTSPQPSAVDQNPFAMTFGSGDRALWGRPYDRKTAARKQLMEAASNWHLTQMKMDDARRVWDLRHPGRRMGDGIIVAHPDTGFTGHPELGNRVSDAGRSFLRDSNGNEEPDARDDLREAGGIVPDQPGHGTATGSIIISGASDAIAAGAEQVFGVAPGATLLPLRVSRSVIHFDFSNVGRAILYAVEQNADVISMSLGGPLHSDFVHRCIREAREKGVIVVSAAGNQIPTTVFPAAFPEVIAVAATHAAEAPWSHSGLGPLVDIAAPGEGVWCARASLDGERPTFSSSPGTGTSFGTANVAGLAAVWLAYHGGRVEVAKKYGDKLSLVPVAFQLLLGKTANSSFPFVKKGRHGAGIPDAGALLGATLPSRRTVEDFERKLRKQQTGKLTFLTGLLSGWRGVTGDIGQADPETAPDAAERIALAEREQDQAAQLLGLLLGTPAGDQPDLLVDELAARIAGDRRLLVGLHRWRQGDSLLPIFDRLIGAAAGAPVDAPGPTLSTELRDRLEERRKAERKRLEPLHRGRLTPPETPSRVGAAPSSAFDAPATPAHRPLRAYAFDPSLETKLETAPINQVTVPARWEHVEPGPVGEYLEVIDIDPASGCLYAPVDLNHPHVLAQNGLPPSEGNPQFHQQMVYAVAMNTINRFELALGRPIFWSSIRPWLGAKSPETDYYTPEARTLIAEALAKDAREGKTSLWDVQRVHLRDRYVQRLRIYPHALRDTNAYYSPDKRALLFGYFPASDDDVGTHYPGGTVFTCLSQDIITHEMTHALLDGMHPYFNEPTNADVWAFHEAFADIMALFQHFTFPDVLRHQIAHTRGDLQTGNLLGELAQQFGQTTTGRSALRSYLGEPNEKGEWERTKPRPDALRTAHQPHERGKILVAAVFDAFLNLYNYRVADLIRISTGGSGVLPAGRIHPDLVNRLAAEAAAAAEEILRICIRALDYVPPIDITFGEFLRALVTADYDLAPTERRNRIAFIDAFRSWGIYPRDVRTLSEDTLRWHRPADTGALTNLTRVRLASGGQYYLDSYLDILEQLAPALNAWQPRGSTTSASSDARREIFGNILDAQAALHSALGDMQRQIDGALLPGLDLRDRAGFSVGNLRPARRIGLQGEFHTEMVFEVVQSSPSLAGAPAGASPFRGGATLIVDLRSWDIRYIIYKRLYDELPDRPRGSGRLAARSQRQLRFEAEQRMGVAGDAQAVWRGEDGDDLVGWHTATYSTADDLVRRAAASRREPFAFLHRSLE